MTKWEYLSHLYIDPAKLSELGSQGWELCCAVGKDSNYLIFKRPVTESTEAAAQKKKGYSDYL